MDEDDQKQFLGVHRDVADQKGEKEGETGLSSVWSSAQRSEVSMVPPLKIPPPRTGVWQKTHEVLTRDWQMSPRRVQEMFKLLPTRCPYCQDPRWMIDTFRGIESLMCGKCECPVTKISRN